MFLPLLLPSSFLFLFWRNRVLFLLVCFPCCGPNCTFSSVWKRKAAKATLEEEKWNKLSSFSLFFLSPFRIPFPKTVVRTGAFVSWGIERKKKGRRRRGIHSIPCTRWRKNKAGETRKSLQQNFLFLLVGRTIWWEMCFPVLFVFDLISFPLAVFFSAVNETRYDKRRKEERRVD